MKLPTDTTAADFTQYQLPEPAPDNGVPIVQSANGAILSTGDFASPNYVPGVTGWKLDAQGNFEGLSGTFSGTVNVSSLNIPNSTSANSYHTDSNGNSWWGANVASGYASANAYILNTGVAVFKNISIGGTTVQYVITNSGIFSYGDGSDGTATCDGSTAVAGMSLAGSVYTMTRDVYFTTLTNNSGITINLGSYRMFCSVLLTNNGTIHRNGNTGSNGGIGGGGANNGGAGGTALADGYLKGSLAGSNGGKGGTGADNSGTSLPGTVGQDGVAIANSLGSSSVGSGTGGNGNGLNSNVGAISGNTAIATTSNVKLIANWHLATLLDVSASGSTVKFTSSASAPGAGGGGGGGGGGAGNNGGQGGGGAGAGSPGGIVAIYARSLVIGAAGIISANGGNGGIGGTGESATTQPNAGGGGGGGGGAGGNGGIVVLVYNILTNSGAIKASAGAKGTGGIGGTKTGSGQNGSNGTDGTIGSAGAIYQFQLSL